MLKEKTLSEEVRDLLTDLNYHSNEVVANIFIPFVVFDKEKTIYHIKQMKKKLDELLKVI